jgi:small ligand-binding sensory domain FIST
MSSTTAEAGPFRIAITGGDSWASAAKELETGLAGLEARPGRQNLGFLYVTDALAEDFGSIVSYLRQKTGVHHWVGSVGMGIAAVAPDADGRWAGHEWFGRPGAAALVADFPRDGFRVLPRLGRGVDEIGTEMRGWMASATPPFGIVHGDPMNGAVPDLVEALAREMENAQLEVPGFLVGGLTSSMGAHYQLADDVVGGGLSGALFAPGVEVATGLSQGCQPLGPVHRITDCMENVVMTLDGEPALDVFKRDIGELLARDLARVAGYIHAAFPVTGSDMGDYVVRNLMGIDTEHRWLAVGGLVSNGDGVLFVRRDPAGAEADLVHMVESLKARAPGPARGAVYFSCVARGPGMFGAEGRETELIHEILGDIPLVGFFGQGEISNTRLYGYTGVLTLFL